MVKINAGDVLLFKSSGTFVEDIVCDVTKSEYCHVAIAVGDGTLIEANGFIKTREIPVTQEPGFDVFRVPGLTASQAYRIVEYAKKQIGTHYDYEKIIGLLIRFELFPHFKGLTEEGHFICSGLVDDALIAGGVPRKNQEFIGNLAPCELTEYYHLKRVLA